MPNIAHGKETCLWCDRCGVLVFDKCRCGGESREFEINSPGDIRPCFGESRDLVLSLFRRLLGTSLPLENRMIFLNKVPGEDRADEIIAHGAVVGLLRFDLRMDDYILELRQRGAEIFSGVAKKNVVTFTSMSGHLKGKAVPGENISGVLGDFLAGEYVILKKGNKIGAGTALGGSHELRDMEKAVKIKDIREADVSPLSPEADIETFVSCNEGHLKAIEKNASSDIKSFLSKKNVPVTASFSGGKDSLAALGIALNAVKDIELLFIDTGLEFPETVEYVKSFSQKNNLKMHVAEAGNSFHENVDAFGPPAKDFRWCCKVCKLGPITELISKEHPKGTVTVEGNRMLESFSRSKIGFVSKNPFVPNQICLNPVRGWNAAEIWGYIWVKGLDYNPLYDKDFERIGCYLCASCLASEWKNTGRIHPELHGRWNSFLHRYADENGLPNEYADMGFWRWKVLPPKMVRLAEELNLKLEPKGSDRLSVKMLKGASSCAAGGYSVEAVVSIPRKRDFSSVEDTLRTLGEVRYSPEFEIAMLKAKNGTVKMFGGGQLSVTSKSIGDAESLYEHAVKALLRAQMCTSCGICAKSCTHKAISVDGGIHINPDRCISCGKCEKSCMVAHYYDKLVQDV